MTSSTLPTVLVAGASRGLGLALVEEYLRRGWRVIATVRGAPPTALAGLSDAPGDRLGIEHLDIASGEDIAALRRRLDGQAIDLLFVNAGLAPENRNADAASIGDAEFARVMATNVLGPMRMLEAFDTLVPANGILAVMSSRLGSIAENEIDLGWAVYRSSKVALNQMLRSFANARVGAGRTVLAVAPGWVRTAMGGADAPLTVDQSIPRVVDVVASHAGVPGAHFVNYEGDVVPW